MPRLARQSVAFLRHCAFAVLRACSAWLWGKWFVFRDLFVSGVVLALLWRQDWSLPNASEGDVLTGLITIATVLTAVSFGSFQMLAGFATSERFAALKATSWDSWKRLWRLNLYAALAGFTFVVLLVSMQVRGTGRASEATMWALAFLTLTWTLKTLVLVVGVLMSDAPSKRSEGHREDIGEPAVVHLPSRRA